MRKQKRFLVKARPVFNEPVNGTQCLYHAIEPNSLKIALFFRLIYSLSAIEEFTLLSSIYFIDIIFGFWPFASFISLSLQMCRELIAVYVTKRREEDIEFLFFTGVCIIFAIVNARNRWQKK